MRPMTVMLIVTGMTLLAAIAPRAARAQPLQQQPDIRRDQIAAANTRALEALRAQVLSESIGPGVTVQDLLDRTGGGKQFMKTLSRANQIGGPRWIDAETCQVRLEIPGPRLVRGLVEIATLSRLESPVPPDVLQGRLRNWNQRTFSATGTSTGAAWVETMVSDDAAKKGVNAARNNAVTQTIDAIRPIPLAGGKTVGDALTDPAVGPPLEKWLAERPVTQVDFPDAAQVRVTLSAQPAEVFDTFRALASRQKNVPLPANENEWARVRDEFAARITPAAMRGIARKPAAAAVAGGDAMAPAPQHAVIANGVDAPEWVDRQIDAQGVGTATGSRLKAARAAEADAANNLRAKLGPLPLANGVTVEQAVRREKRLENALDRALLKARTTASDYPADGSARVTMQLDLRDVWEELAAAQ